MKKIFSFIFSIVLFFTANAQSPNAINYQAVARNNSGTLLANQAVSLQISFLDLSPSGTVVYSERHNVSTNVLGLFTLQIGTGSIQSGNFSTINWGTGSKFIKIEMDAAGGTNYTNLGTSQIISVPYSLYSNVAGLANGLNGSATIAPSQLTNGGATANQILLWNGTAWIPSTLNINQNTDVTLKGNGSVANPLGLAQQSATNGQILKWNGSAWTPGNDNNSGGDITDVIAGNGLTGGGTTGSVTLNANDISPTNELQSLSLKNDTIYLNNGGYVKIPVSNNHWKTAGNSGIVDGTNFIGTTDNVALNFRINNQKAGRIDSVNQSAFLGYGSGKNNSGTNNTFIGYKSGNLNTSGINNTAIGDSALFSNTTGSNSIAIGKGALKSATNSSFSNVAIGSKALYYNTSGYNNIAIGQDVLLNNTNGRDNIAVGSHAMKYNSAGTYNIAFVLKLYLQILREIKI